MNNKKISVLTTLYNHEAYIKETLESAISQSLMPDEIIVIDDASSDSSLNIVASITHPALHVICEPYNLGGATTMKGLEACTGDYVAILNSDDSWEKDKLNKQMLYMEQNPGCGIVFTRVKILDSESRPIPKGSHQLTSVFSLENRDCPSWLRHFFYHGKAFCVSSALIRRECLDRIGPLNGKFIQLQDFDFWFRAAMAGFELHVIEDVLTNYRITLGTNMSTPNRSSLAVFQLEFVRVLKHLWQLETLAQLRNVFPELVFHPDADDGLTLFYLARLAAQQGTPHHRLFAAETLFHWSANEQAMRNAQKCHGFGFQEYAAMMADTPLRNDLQPALRSFLRTFLVRVTPQWCIPLWRRWTA